MAVEDDAPVRSEAENPQEYDAYNQVLLHAHQFTLAELEPHAEKGVQFLDLVRPVRQDFRYRLLYFEGRLKMLRRLEPTRLLKDAGIENLYEGWLFPTNGADPMCVLTTELPPGLEARGEFPDVKQVAVAGFYFKLIRYESRAPHKSDKSRQEVRRAPLLMAPSFRILPEPDRDGGAPWRSGFLPGAAALAAVLILAAGGLTWWFRRGDRRLRSELETRRALNPFETMPTRETES